MQDYSSIFGQRAARYVKASELFSGICSGLISSHLWLHWLRSWAVLALGDAKKAIRFPGHSLRLPQNVMIEALDDCLR